MHETSSDFVKTVENSLEYTQITLWPGNAGGVVYVYKNHQAEVY